MFFLDIYYDFIQQRIELLDKCKEFCDLFNAEDVIYEQSASDISFGGLAFSPEKDRKFWTIPTRNDPFQNPRASLKKACKQDRLEHKALLKKWNDNRPKVCVSKDKLYESIGTNWGNLMFSSGGFSLFRHNSFIYVKTSVSLNEHMTEILGSEFKSAKELYAASTN